tara:strand:- start:1209 stop:2171 length:963 start_codon:yes stop_codon:yes gene_type:complete
MEGRMEIAFFTEGKPCNKVLRTYPNMRTDLAWICALDAKKCNLFQALDTTKDIHGVPSIDLGIVILPKKNIDILMRNSIDNLYTVCKKVAIMQEGPFWYFQDYSLDKQIYYFNSLVSADILFVHNEHDRKYYKGLTNHSDIRILPSLMIEDSIGEIHTEDRSGIMIGGNMVSWYSGFDSFMLASSVTDEIYSPKMGRAIDGEMELGIKQLPYLQWKDWITELSKRKLGIHMMRTHAAGTFALNCSYLGIPCVGYKGLDTQRILHPALSVDDGDMETARKLVNKLWNNLDFYKENCILTKRLYKEKYSENIFKKTFYNGFQ